MDVEHIDQWSELTERAERFLDSHGMKAVDGRVASTCGLWVVGTDSGALRIDLKRGPTNQSVYYVQSSGKFIMNRGLVPEALGKLRRAQLLDDLAKV